MAAQEATQEFVVRVPQETNKKYHVMRFHSALNVDVTKWKNVKLERENNAREFKGGEEEDDIPKFGAGSEFGRDAREEARKKKYTRRKKYNPDDQPWSLRVGGKSGKKFRGIREGGVSENACYYVFFQASDGAFDAFPVNEWYNFTAIKRYKALTAEEAEEQFEKRDKILNYFSVMVSKKKKDSEVADGSFVEDKQSKKKGRGGFKVTDLDEWGFDSEDGRGSDDEESGDEGYKKGKNKKGAKKKNNKKKKKDSDDDEESALEESDEGDFDQREVDYMTSSSDEEGSDDDRNNREMKGVEDEDGLKQLQVTDDEDEENAEDEDGKKKDKPADDASKPDETKSKPEKEAVSESSAEESEGSDIDEAKFTSSIFMQKKANKKNGSEQGSGPSSRSDTPSKEVKDVKDVLDGESTKAVKRKLDQSLSTQPAKKAKSGDGGNGFEEAIRRYLTRKPMTAKELIKKFTKSKSINMSREHLVHTIAEILKKLNPEKQKIKEELYLSLKP